MIGGSEKNLPEVLALNGRYACKRNPEIAAWFPSVIFKGEETKRKETLAFALEKRRLCEQGGSPCVGCGLSILIEKLTV